MRRTKIDPHTGVEVLTTAGYIAHEAQRKGVSYEQEQESFWADMAAAEAEEEQSLRDNALAILQNAVREENRWLREQDDGEQEIPEPVEIIEFRSLDAGSIMSRHLTQRIEAYAKRPDGSEGVITWVHEHYSGSYLEPPETEVQVWWEDPTG